MDIQLLQKFKELINQQYDEMVISQIEQYKCEVEQLNELLINTTTLIKEKEEIIGDLEKQVADNKFEESNYTNVSIISNLNKQIHELSSKNSLLETSLRIRNTSSQPEENLSMETNEAESSLVHTNTLQVEDAIEKLEEAIAEGGENETAEAVANEAEEDPVNTVVEVEVEDNTEVTEEVVSGTDEEVEVTEIEYKGKNYYVQNSIMYNKKKNGDMGKEVGKIVSGKPKLNKKKKKDASS
jgi:hypothetical protein